MVEKKSILFFSALLALCFINNFALSAWNNNLKCKLCNDYIESRYITFKNNAYHEKCYKDHIQLRCFHCKNTISGEYNIDNGKNYHKLCFRNFILQKCDVCFKPIDDLYIKDHYGNTYHNYHRSTMPTCESCNRLISSSITNGGIKINKKRNVCNLCRKHTVNDKSKVNTIFLDVRDELISLGISNIPEQIPIHLVESKGKLQKISEIFLPIGLQGYTKYEYQKIGKKKINENYTIYILSHLHEINFRAVLAHELLHVYLYKNDIHLKKSLVEGFCNLGSEHIYKSYGESKIARLRLDAMAKDDDPDYGKGYRIMSSELETNGWRKLLKKLEKY